MGLHESEKEMTLLRTEAEMDTATCRQHAEQLEARLKEVEESLQTAQSELPRKRTLEASLQKLNEDYDDLTGQFERQVEIISNTCGENQRVKIELDNVREEFHSLQMRLQKRSKNLRCPTGQFSISSNS